MVSGASQVGVGSASILAGRFVGFLLAAQILGGDAFGVFAVVQSYAALIERLFNVQSWQLLVKRMAALRDAEPKLRAAIVSAAIAADLIGAFAAFCTAVVGLALAGPHFGVNGQMVLAAQIYCAIVFCNAHGAWAGILRSLGNYGQYAFYQIFAGSAIVAAVGIVKWLHIDATAASILFAWLGAELLAYLFLSVTALAALRRGMVPLRNLVSSLPQVSRELRSGLGFLLSVNVGGSLRMATKEGDVLAVGAAIGSEAAGIYKIGKNLAVLPLLVTDSLYYMIYPKFAELHAKQQLARARSLVRHSSLLGTLVGLVSVAAVFMIGQKVLQLLSVEDVRAFSVMAVCVIATSLATATFPFAPALLACGEHRHQLVALAAGTGAFFATFLVSVRSLDVVGAALGAVAFYVVWIAVVAPRLRSRGML